VTFIGSISGSSSGSGGYSLPQNTNSIQGLASGIDTQSIVNGLVQAAQAPLVTMMQQRQVLQWKSEQFQQVNTALTNLQSSLSSMRLQSSFLVQQTSSTNSSLITASSNGLAANGTYSVAVTQLAEGATISSGSSLSVDSTYADTKLANLAGSPLGSYSSSPFSILVNGQSISIDPSADTINTVLQKISSNTSARVSAFYDTNSGKVVMQTTATGSSAYISLSADAASNQFFQNTLHLTQPQSSITSGTIVDPLTSGGVVDINGQKIALSANETLAQVATDITTATSNFGVTATAGSGMITLSTANLYSPLNISDPSNLLNLQSPTIPAGDTASEDAVYSVNGVASTSPNNNPVFNGVSLNLQGVTGTANPVTVTVSSNTSQIEQTITNFVQTYNQTLQTMQGLYNQQRNYSYQPLTAAQEAQMSSTQIDEWNQKAQAGMLAFDPTLGSSMSNMQNAVSTILSGLTSNGSTTSLSSIGITPIDPMNGVSSGSTAPGVTTTGWNTYGLLQINTAQLTQALQSNPQAVMSLFTNNSTDTTEEGLAKQLYTSVSNSITQIKQEAGLSITPLPTAPNSNTGQILLPSTAIDPNADLASLFSPDTYDTSFLGTQISSIDTRAEQIQKQISSQQTMWQNQFAQMEQAIQSLNSQQSQLIGMLSSSGG
jgi:flagellar hook-associated protein 2